MTTTRTTSSSSRMSRRVRRCVRGVGMSPAAAGGGRYSLSRKEGWRRFVDTPPRQWPDPLTGAGLRRLGGAAREDYDEGRHDWHANFGILKTPQLAAVSEEL